MPTMLCYGFLISICHRGSFLVRHSDRRSLQQHIADVERKPTKNTGRTAGWGGCRGRGTQRRTSIVYTPHRSLVGCAPPTHQCLVFVPARTGPPPITCLRINGFTNSSSVFTFRTWRLAALPAAQRTCSGCWGKSLLKLWCLEDGGQLKEQNTSSTSALTVAV